MASAKAALEDLKKSFTGLASQIGGDTRTASTAIERLNTAMKSIKGIDRGAISSFTQLQSAISQIGDASKLRGLAAELQKLSSADFSKLGGQFRSLSAALASIKVPPGLTTLVATLRTIASEAQKTGAAAAVASGQLNKLGSAGSQANGGISSLGGGLSSVRNVLAGFGVAIGAAGFSQFVSSSIEAANSLTRFQSQITAVTGSTEIAAESLKYVTDYADKFAIDINTARNGYAAFASAAALSNVSLEDTRTIFEGVSLASKGLNLSNEKTGKAFLALEQMLSKGKVQFEELRGQLSEAIPGAAGLFAKSMGVSTAELERLVRAGQVGVPEIIKFAEALKTQFGAAAEAAAQNFQSAQVRLSNSIVKLKEAFGGAFEGAFAASLQKLAAAIKDPAIISAVQSLGFAFGEIASGATAAFQVIGQAIAGFVNSIANAYTNITNFLTSIGLLSQQSTTAAGSATNLGTAFKLLGAVLAGFIIVTTIAAGVFALKIAFEAASAASLLLARGVTAILAAGGPLTKILTIVAGVAVVAAAHFGLFEKANQALGEVLPKVTTGIEDYSGSTDELKNKMAAISETSGEFKTKQEEIATAFGKIESSTKTLPGALGSLQTTLAALTEPTASVADSSNRLAAAFNELSTTTPSIATNLQTVSAAVSAINDPLATFATSAADLATQMTTLSGSLPSVSDGFTQIAAAVTQLAGPLPELVSNLERLGAQAEPIGSVKDAFVAFVDAVTSAIPQIESAVSQMDALAKAGDGVKTGFGNAVTAGGNFIEQLGNVSSAVSSLITQMNNLKSAAEAALRAAQAAQSAGGGGDTGSGRYGGLSGSLPESVNAPLGAFKNAPQFREGTANTSGQSSKIPGGGIPSILHPNEAVVPLPKGRSIPVDLNLTMNAADTAPTKLSPRLPPRPHAPH